MAMSLKKITAIAVGGAMVASTLASGVAAETVVIGDVKEFMKNVVVDGKPNVDIVVGSKAAAMDVVSAADIAAKIGSMCYKDVVIEDGKVELNIETSADTELSDDLNRYNDGSQFFIFTTPERIYTDNLGRGSVLNGLVEHNASASIQIEEQSIINGILENVDMRITSGDLVRGAVTAAEVREGILSGAIVRGSLNISGNINGTDVDQDTINVSGYIKGIINDGRIRGKINLTINASLDNNVGDINGTTVVANIIGSWNNTNIDGTITDGYVNVMLNGSEYRRFEITGGEINGSLVRLVNGVLAGNITDIDIQVDGGEINRIYNLTTPINISGVDTLGNMEIMHISDGNITVMNLENADAMFNGTIRYNDTTDIEVQRLSRLSTLVKDDDADPNDVSSDKKADAIEFLLASVNKEDDDEFEIRSGDLVYGTLIFRNKENNLSRLLPVYIGMEIPLLGEPYRIIDVNDNEIYIGKELYAGIVREGKSQDLGNGYEIRVVKILQQISGGKEDVIAEVEIIKDGKVVRSKSEKVPFELTYGNIGIRVYEAYKDVPEYAGYASVIVAKDLKECELGKEFMKDWKLYAITLENGVLTCTDEALVENYSDMEAGRSKTEFLHVENDPTKRIYGFALRYEGSGRSINNKGEVPFPNEYAILEFTDDGDPNRIFARYKMEIDKDVVLNVGEKVNVLGTTLKLKDIKATAQEVVPVKTPIAKLDTEASLDTDKYLILVGGPVANKLSEELQKQGKININNDSPATLQVVDGRILVVAGGDRYKTREAALYLIQNY
ncbi:S-layer protein [Methanothermococcus sp. SCGC AD-155-E23]|nr:S-layer protein [Methanothermococcus sp. SCGC AD-155-E23]